MILDEIYYSVKAFRNRGNGSLTCPFPSNCDYCRLIFREITIPKNNKFMQAIHNSNVDGSGWPDCPCLQLDEDYVKSEMRRLFP